MRFFAPLTQFTFAQVKQQRPLHVSCGSLNLKAPFYVGKSGDLRVRLRAGWRQREWGH